MIHTIIPHRCGWEFRFHPLRVMEFTSKHPMKGVLIGTGPFIVDRRDGTVEQHGSGNPAETMLAQHRRYDAETGETLFEAGGGVGEMGGSYELRYRYNLPTLGRCALAGGFVALGFIPGMPLVVAVLVWLFFGGGLVLMLTAPLRRTPVLRVDASGVMLGSLLADVRRTTVRLPWDRVGAVVVTQFTYERRRHKMVGVVAAEGIRDLPGSGPEWLRNVSKAIAGPMATASRPLAGLRLDLPRMASVMRDVAPTVLLVDETTDPPTYLRDGQGP